MYFNQNIHLPSEEVYSSSPSSHIVPCSPFLNNRSRSPVPCVPDIDRLNRRKAVRSLSQDILPSPVLSALQSSQTDSQPQRLPFTPIGNMVDPAVIKKPTNLTTPSLEQVVPSCSPSTVQDEKPANGTQRKNGRKLKLEKSLDEKPPIPKRQNRNLKAAKSQENAEMNLFQRDDIFG
ncbi:uncharacterized protein LOC130656992 [Hydractinia symbiolongicarpus]|uniref:uncharacterized protein LOC130656992 n=1 Tax=Hydractinia symbiolongicarpus TaxID=13093 RepID=UPI00254DCBDF|nr:uncharacterized protein LOC130656992 [Hydractinia symbiolongicarpus]